VARAAGGLTMGRIETICIGREKGGKKTAVPSARLIANHGLEGDAHAGPGHRQVSLLGAAELDAERAKGRPELSAGDYAANLLLSGLELSALGPGSVLRLGATAELTVTQLGKTCHAPCAIAAQTGDCLMPRAGLFARVTAGGAIAVGDTAAVLAAVPRAAFQAVVLTASDRGARGETTDTAGPAVADLLRRRLAAHVYACEILPDDHARLVGRLRHYSAGHSIDLVLVVGGTGFAPRDVTPEAVRAVVERLTPGLDEAMRTASLAQTPHAMLSRAVSGIRQGTLIISLPGSARAALENLAAVLPALEHGLRKLRGDPTDCGRPAAEAG